MIIVGSVGALCFIAFLSLVLGAVKEAHEKRGLHTAIKETAFLVPADRRIVQNPRPDRGSFQHPIDRSEAPEVVSDTSTQALSHPSLSPAALPQPSLSEAWVVPLFSRTRRAADWDAVLSADFLDIILRVEAMYDPTRLDGTGQMPRLGIRPGTAASTSVFADRWTIGDTDANVDYAVTYSAYAWTGHGPSDCTSMRKRRFLFNKILAGNLYLSDCNRVKRIRNDASDRFSGFRIIPAPLSVPAFAAPLPGARLSAEDFWAQKEARNIMIKEALRLKREGKLPIGIAP